MSTSAKQRFNECSRNMLKAFSTSPHHQAALAHALRDNGLSSVDDVSDEKLFDVTEAARSYAGWGTGLMFASAAFGLKPDELHSQPPSAREKIESMAREYYTSGKADEEICPRPAPGGAVKSGENNTEFLDGLNKKMMRH